MMSKIVMTCITGDQSNTSPNKRLKTRDDQDMDVDSVPANLEATTLVKKNTKIVLSSLKGESGFKLNKAISKKPKKNITAYAFFIKEQKKEFGCIHLTSQEDLSKDSELGKSENDQDLQSPKVKSRSPKKCDCSGQTKMATVMMKELGAKWSNMAEEDKASYLKLAEQDKERYQKEVNDFSEKYGDPELFKELESKRPKKALSAYMIFVRETRSKVCIEYPEMHALEVMKEVGKAWQSLSVEDKDFYAKQALVDKQRFTEEMEEFEKIFHSKTRHIQDTTETSPVVQIEKQNKVATSPRKLISSGRKNQPKKLEEISKKKRDLKSVKKLILESSQVDSCSIQLTEIEENHYLIPPKVNTKRVVVKHQQQVKETILEGYKTQKRRSIKTDRLDDLLKNSSGHKNPGDACDVSSPVSAYSKTQVPLCHQLQDEAVRTEGDTVTRSPQVHEKNYMETYNQNFRGLHTLKIKNVLTGNQQVNRKNVENTEEVIRLETPLYECMDRYAYTQETPTHEKVEEVHRNTDLYHSSDTPVCSDCDEDLVERNTHICGGSNFDFDEEFNKGFGSPLPFLNIPRNTYKSLLDMSLENYLQGMFSN